MYLKYHPSRTVPASLNTGILKAYSVPEKRNVKRKIFFLKAIAPYVCLVLKINISSANLFEKKIFNCGGKSGKTFKRFKMYGTKEPITDGVENKYKSVFVIVQGIYLIFLKISICASEL